MDIKHVVVLMLENRSFDCMLGKLYPSGPAFDGLTRIREQPMAPAGWVNQEHPGLERPDVDASGTVHTRSRSG